MTATLTNSSRQDTGSNVSSFDFKPETRQLHENDWWVAGSSSTAVLDETSTAQACESASGLTEQIGLPDRPELISKERNEVKILGDRKTLLQQWECIVLGRDDDETLIHCEMHDLTNESSPVEFAEIYMAEFNRYDLPLLVENAVFYWSVGHLRKENGQVLRFSEIRVRRMPKLSRFQKQAITRKVDQLNGLFFNQ